MLTHTPDTLDETAAMLDDFAKAALTGILAGSTVKYALTVSMCEDVAAEAYAMALAMCSARLDARAALAAQTKKPATA